MALTVLGTEVNNETAYAKSLTIPEGTTGIMVLLNCGNNAPSTYTRIGGKNLVRVGTVVTNVYRVDGWLLDSMTGVSGSAMTWSGPYPYTSQFTATIVYLGGGSPLFNLWRGTAFTGVGTCHLHEAPPYNNQVAVGHGHSYSGSRTHCSGQTPIVTNTGNVTSGYKVGADGGSLTVGMQNISTAGVVGSVSMWDGNPDRIAVPEPVGMEVTVPDADWAVDTDIVARVETIGLKVTVPVPTISVPLPRVIPLVGIYAEAPGRVPPSVGLTTPMLSEVDGIPKWVEAPISTGDPGPPGEDGATWYDGSGVPAPEVGADDDYYLERG
jgi:hypothetical protein